MAETRTAYVRRVQRREPVHEAREKWTLKKLFKETIRFSKNRRRYSSSGRTRLVKVIPYVGTKTAVIHLESFGVTSKAIHQIFISFHGLHITERVMGAGYFRVQYGGDDYWIRKPDISKATTLLQWMPKVSLEDGLSKTIAYFKKRIEPSR